MSYLPDLELGVNRHRVEGEGSWWDVTLSVPIPLFFWQPKKGEIAEAEANILARLVLPTPIGPSTAMYRFSSPTYNLIVP